MDPSAGLVQDPTHLISGLNTQPRRGLFLLYRGGLMLAELEQNRRRFLISQKSAGVISKA
jgi:hypothetical protein